MDDPGEVRPQNILKGVTLIVATTFTISVQDVIFKIFSSEMTLWQIFTLRGILAVSLLLAISGMRGGLLADVKAALGKWSIVRALFLTSTFLLFYAAIPFLSLSVVGAANYIAPIFVALLSAYVIREAVSPLGWFGVFLGFAGVMVLLQPGTESFSRWTVLPVIGAAFYALAHITTRTRCQDVSLLAIGLSVNLIMTLSGLLVSGLLILFPVDQQFAIDLPYIFGSWSVVEASDWLVLAVLAVITVSLAVMLAGAYKAAPPSTIATFEYSYLVFVAIWDILFFGITHTYVSVSGMMLIVVAGLFVLRK